MAIIKEFYKTRTDGISLYKTYSDEGFYIHKIETEEIYDEAIDIESASYEYEETEEKINGKELSELELKAQAYDILIGEVE